MSKAIGAFCWHSGALRPRSCSGAGKMAKPLQTIRKGAGDRLFDKALTSQFREITARTTLPHPRLSLRHPPSQIA